MYVVNDSKDIMAMQKGDNLKEHRSSPVNGVHVTTCRRETKIAAESNMFEITGARGVEVSKTLRSVKQILDIIMHIK